MDDARGIVALVSASEEGRPALLRWARKEAEWHVAQSWPAITALAPVLSERLYLAGEDISELKGQVDVIWAQERAKVRDAILADPELKRRAALPWRRTRTVPKRVIADAVLAHLIQNRKLDDEQFAGAVRTLAIIRDFDPELAIQKLASLANRKKLACRANRNAWQYRRGAPAPTDTRRRSRRADSPVCSLSAEGH